MRFTLSLAALTMVTFGIAACSSAVAPSAGDVSAAQQAVRNDVRTQSSGSAPADLICCEWNGGFQFGNKTQADCDGLGGRQSQAPSDCDEVCCRDGRDGSQFDYPRAMCIGYYSVESEGPCPGAEAD
jgi:hypothetical protein